MTEEEWAMNLDLVICGLGGTGTVLVGRILMRAASLDGLDARSSEDHGHAKRGGSVKVDLRVGEAYSPAISERGAHGLLAMEPLEAARQLRWVRPGAVAVIDSQEDLSLAVQLGLAERSDMEELRGAIQRQCGTVFWMDGRAIARDADNVRSLNVALMGAFWEALGRPFSEESVQAAIRATLPQKIVPVNERAFKLGAQRVAERRS